jgi:hypothetical protein
MSTMTASGRRPARSPLAPSLTASSASGSVTMMNTMSAAEATSRGESASRSPASTSQRALLAVRL